MRQGVMWISVALLLVLAPLPSFAQSQDIHALRVVSQAFEKAKKDNQSRRDNAVLIKTHRIENLNVDGNFESLEKQMIYKSFSKNENDGKIYVEKLTAIWPPKAEPAINPLDFDKLLDIFLIRFYFSISPETELIDRQTCLKVNFWPREDVPQIKEDSDHVINAIAGTLYIDEKKLTLKKIEGSIREDIDKSPFFYMSRFDFFVEIKDWNGLGLISTMEATTKYQYRNWNKWFRVTKRFQTHKFWYGYVVE